jgi:hypothetical protein
VPGFELYKQPESPGRRFDLFDVDIEDAQAGCIIHQEKLTFQGCEL